MTPRDDFRHDRRVKDKLHKLIRRGSLHCRNKMLKIWRVLGLLTPELVKKRPLIVKCSAVYDEVFNISKEVLARTEKAKPFFVGL